MNLRYLVAAFAGAGFGLGAVAQTACPTPEALSGDAASVVDLFAGLSARAVEKGEFETTEQFEARQRAAGDPPPIVIRVDTAARKYTYDADRQAFKLFAASIEPTSLYRDDYRLGDLRDVLGGAGYYNPVHLSVKGEIVSEREYEATNAYGAVTLVTERRSNDYVVFDNRGRRGYSVSDTLFEERKKYEPTYLWIPVPIDRAPEIKSQLDMVALIDPRAPLTAESDYRFEPTRDRPIDSRTHYNIVFADIRCIGVRDGDGKLLAHWATR